MPAASADQLVEAPWGYQKSKVDVDYTRCHCPWGIWVDCVIPLLAGTYSYDQLCDLLCQKGCGVYPAGKDVVWFLGISLSAKLVCAAICSFLSAHGREIDVASNSTSVSKPFSGLPEISTSYVDKCPDSVMTCSSDHPFTFTSNYTLSSQNFALNLDTPFSAPSVRSMLSPHQAMEVLTSSDGQNFLGLFYGSIDNPARCPPTTQRQLTLSRCYRLVTHHSYEANCQQL